MKDKIVEINEGIKFYVLEELSIDGKNYLIGPILDDKKDEINKMICQEFIIENGVGRTYNVDSPEILEKIEKKLLENRNV